MRESDGWIGGRTSERNTVLVSIGGSEMTEIIDAEESNKAIRLVNALRPRIQEVPNPAYVKDQKERSKFVPARCSITLTGTGKYPSLNEIMQDGYQRYEMDALLRIREFCDHCTDCEDCAYAGEMRAVDACRLVKMEFGGRK